MATFGLSGGNGGEFYTDNLKLFQLENGPPPIPIEKISAITIWYGWYVDGLQIEYQDFQRNTYPGDMHGQTGGGGLIPQRYPLGPGEYIIGIEGRTGKYVDLLTVILNSGQKLDPFGGDGGNQVFHYQLNPVKSTTDDRGHILSTCGEHVIGFFGNNGQYIDSIGIYTRSF